MIMDNGQLIPALRFSEFVEEWQLKLLKDLTNVLRCGIASTPKYIEDGVPFLSSQNVTKEGELSLEKFNYISHEFYKKISKNKLNKGDILYSRVGASYGNAAIFPFESEYGVYVSLTHISPKSCLNNVFLKYYLNSSYGKKQAKRGVFQGGGVPNLNVKVVEKFKILYPTIQEQQKIANFLTTIDQRITKLKEKKAALEDYKKGLMQKIFSQEIRFNAQGCANTSVTGCEGEISTKGCVNAASAGSARAAEDDEGNDFPDWEEKRLKDVFSRSTLKNRDNKISNVFTNSAKSGIVNQMDFFDHSVANKNNLERYYVVNKDDFVYNPRISKSAPVGPLKRNKLETGAMSPLYTVLNHKLGNKTFLEYYFETTHWHRYMCGIANYGARHDRMNIQNSDFMNLPIPYPCIEEQQKIADCLSAIDQSINQLTKQIDQTIQFKKGLLQRMFV